MKKNAQAFYAAILFNLLALLPTQSVQAQGDPSKKLPYCDQVTNLVKKEMQDQANMDCQTVFRCVDCMERATGTQKCQPVVVQPGAGCGAVLQPVKDMATAPQAQNMPDGEGKGFRLEIFQSRCFNGGLNLYVMVWSEALNKMDALSGYNFAWELDGKAVASATTARLDCVSGKTVRLTATQLSSGRSQTVAVKIIQAPVADRTTEKSVVAAFKRTGCFGNCPAYTVEFLKDGTVRWTGQANTSPKGQKTAQTPANAMNRIAEKAKVVKFFNMDTHYPKDPIADASTTVIYLNLDGKEKQVEAIAGAPDGFKEFERLFEEILRELGWAKTTGDNTKTDPQKPGKLNGRN